jgi:CO dehydrogenase nickel-insertion accessory protein CooC1
MEDHIEKMDIPLLGVIPADEQLAEFEYAGRPLVELGEESKVYGEVAELLKEILPT